MMAEGEDEVGKEVYKMMREDKVDVGSNKECFEWLGQELEWGGFKSTRMVQVFHILAKMHCKRIQKFE